MLIHQSSTRNSKIALIPKGKNGGERQSKLSVKEVFIAKNTESSSLWFYEEKLINVIVSKQLSLILHKELNVH